MKSLAAAVYDKLNRLVPDRVWYGLAHDAEPTTLYCEFMLGPSFGRQYNGVSAIRNVQYVVPVTVNLYGESDTAVADKLEEVVEDMEGGLALARHLAIRTDTVSHWIEEDPDLAEEGNVVWHGYAVFNVRISRNYNESSSSASSSSSSSSSSTSSASASSASSASSSTASTASTASSPSSASASSLSTASTASSPSSVSASSVSTSSYSSVSASSVSESSSSSSGP